jgi:D-threo-aldose 1-dehydrogenase
MNFGSPPGGRPIDVPQTINLAGARLVTSALGLGCAELYREPSATRRRHVLEVALAAGIRHFDVAPMYGLGVAEAELGRFVRGRRDEIVVATKFGICPSPTARALARVQRPVRRLFSVFPALRQQARTRAAGPASGRAWTLLYRASGYDSSSARESLERSLRELGTDYVDLLLLHDPQPGDVRSDDVCAYLERAYDAGQIRAWGVAGELEPTLRVAQGLPVAPPVLQVRSDLLDSRARNLRGDLCRGVITFGVLGRSVGTIVAHVSADPQRRRVWHDAVGHDCSDPEVIVPLLLRQAVRENPDGVVLFGTIYPEHVLSAATALSGSRNGRDEDLDAFRSLVDAELRIASPDPRTDC